MPHGGIQARAPGRSTYHLSRSGSPACRRRLAEGGRQIARLEIEPLLPVRRGRPRAVGPGRRATEALFRDAVVKDFREIARRAKRKLEALHAAARLDDLRVPPSNRLEKLKGDLKDYYSIRINDQWRVVFRWIDSKAYDVSIVDYH